jgi:hypothetical protein
MLEELIHGLETANAAEVVASMTDNVTLRVAVHDEPFLGRPAAMHILGAVLDGALHDVNVTEMIPGDEVAVLMFSAQVSTHPGAAQGALIVRTDGAGRIQDLTVFLRPLVALRALAEEMGRRLGGPPPVVSQ